MAWVVKRAKLNFKKVFFWNTLMEKLAPDEQPWQWIMSVTELLMALTSSHMPLDGPHMPLEPSGFPISVSE